MNTAFFGKPSGRIKNWIELKLTGQTTTDPDPRPNTPSSADPEQPTTTAIWKEAANPDGTPLSNTDSAEWTSTDTKTYTLTYLEDGSWIAKQEAVGRPSLNLLIPLETVDSSLGEGATATQLQDLAGTLKFFRKYTPAHWEDADGNWTEGSFGDWTVTYTNDPDFSSYRYDQPQLDGDTYLVKLYYRTNPTPFTVRFSQIDSSANAIQNSLLIYRSYSSSVYFATRTWTSTKPAPTA